MMTSTKKKQNKNPVESRLRWVYLITIFNNFYGITKSIKIMMYLITTFKDSIKIMVYSIKTFKNFIKVMLY